MAALVSGAEMKVSCRQSHGKDTGYSRAWQPGCGNCARSSQIVERGWKPPVPLKLWKAPRPRDYQPGEYDAGQVIVWTQEGGERIGTVWSAGPRPRTVWVYPDDAPWSFASMVVVTLPKAGSDDGPWAFGQWYQPDPRAMTNVPEGRSA